MWYLIEELFYRHFGVIITLTLQYSVALEVEIKYNYTYLKGILTFISSAYLPRTSQGACSFTKMMSLFVRDDCKRKTKQPPGLTFSSKKERNHSQWSMWCVTLPSSWFFLKCCINILSTHFSSALLKAMLWLPSGLHEVPLHGKEDMEGRQMHPWVSWLNIAWRELYVGHEHQHGCYLTGSCLAETRGWAAKRRKGGI